MGIGSLLGVLAALQAVFFAGSIPVISTSPFFRGEASSKVGRLNSGGVLWISKTTPVTVNDIAKRFGR